MGSITRAAKAKKTTTTTDNSLLSLLGSARCIPQLSLNSKAERKIGCEDHSGLSVHWSSVGADLCRSLTFLIKWRPFWISKSRYGGILLSIKGLPSLDWDVWDRCLKKTQRFLLGSTGFVLIVRLTSLFISCVYWFLNIISKPPCLSPGTKKVSYDGHHLLKRNEMAIVRNLDSVSSRRMTRAFVEITFQCYQFSSIIILVQTFFSYFMSNLTASQG